MKVNTPEISWHGKEAIFSVDFQLNSGSIIRLATAGLDSNVRIWQYVGGTIKFLSNLSRHDKAVNIVRFSKSSKILASAGDDATIVLWKLSEKNEPGLNIFDEEGKNVETWCSTKVLRGHLEDINDLSWSSDDTCIVTGSVDHTAILWDVEKGQKLAMFNDAKHFVNGVSWDPLGKYVAAMSCDRSTRIYNIHTRKMAFCINKMNQPYQVKGETNVTQKLQRIFHDESVVRRRLSFTPDGKMLITPASCLTEEGSSQQINTVLLFSRANLSKPVAYLPGLSEPASIVACCPVLFQLKKDSTENGLYFKLDYRLIFAVASSETVLIYDTQHLAPFALIANIHYAAITDLSWSSDASFLAISSRDGFCSVIQFEPNELGEKYFISSCIDASSLNPSEEENCATLKTNNISGQENNVDEVITNTPPNIINSTTSLSSPKPRRVALIPVQPTTTLSPTSDSFQKKESKIIKQNKDTDKRRRIQLTTISQ